MVFIRSKELFGGCGLILGGRSFEFSDVNFSWYHVNVFFDAFLDYSKCPDDNRHCYCFQSQHFRNLNFQAPIVQTLDSAIHWINHYPLDNSIGFASVYPLDSDLCGGRRYPSFEQLWPDLYTWIVSLLLLLMYFGQRGLPNLSACISFLAYLL